MNTQPNELIIRIKSTGQIVVEDITDGIVSVKSISHSDLSKSIEKSFKSENFINSGILPQNCIAYKYDTESENQYVAIEVKADCYDITYLKTLYEHFPLPKLVLGFYINKDGYINNVTLGVVPNDTLKENSPMYIYPFSNVFGFSLCTGANRLPVIHSLAQLSNLPLYILSLPNNNDHFNERNNVLRLGHRELMEYMKNKDCNHYYEKVLIPMGNKTPKNFINQ